MAAASDKRYFKPPSTLSRRVRNYTEQYGGCRKQSDACWVVGPAYFTPHASEQGRGLRVSSRLFRRDVWKSHRELKVVFSTGNARLESLVTAFTGFAHISNTMAG
ncbi:hypothetical protein RRG08_048627 [Elysia crispata]|uniref:Uncharacterized protein n=1 Tax=Elysia crispata TaxID=231223 RepID=A0AAE1ADA8_9GAST|nr:hypothetical protein RRG08_048627 [Elysia crispata]